MRIVAGNWKGRSINAPIDLSIRPTTDRVRESIFNIINHRYSGLLQEGRILDLFAGTGAVGLEALSRGAKYALFVENSATSCRLIKQNIDKLSAQACSSILKRDATTLGPISSMSNMLPFNLIFADPPYLKKLGDKALYNAYHNGWISDNSLCILEESKDAELSLPDNFVIEDKRIFSKSCIYFIKINSLLTDDRKND